MIDFGYEFSERKIQVFHRERLQKWLDGENVYPINLSVDLTTVCNYRCSWCCDMDYRHNTGNTHIDTDSLLSVITSLHRHNVLSVTLVGGGEPTLHPQFSLIVDSIFERGVDCGVITNGSLLNRLDSGILRELKFIRVSLDAGDRDTFLYAHGVDGWDSMMDSLSVLGRIKAKSNPPVVGATYLLDDVTKKSLIPALHLCKSLGFDYVQVKPVLDSGGYRHTVLTDNIWEAFDQVRDDKFRVLKSAWEGCVPIDCTGDKCLAHRFVGVILPTGDVSFCCRLKNRKEFNMGNINTRRFSEIWNGNKRMKLIFDVEHSEKFVETMCGGCMLGAINSICNQLQREMLDKGFPVLWRFV